MKVTDHRSRLQRALSGLKFKHSKIPIIITIDELVAIYDRQQGRCAITSLEMTHRFRDMRSISIDRIDSTRGYVPGNVQLVCTAVNRARNNHSQGEVVDFFRACRDAVSGGVELEDQVPDNNSTVAVLFRALVSGWRERERSGVVRLAVVCRLTLTVIGPSQSDYTVYLDVMGLNGSVHRVGIVSLSYNGDSMIVRSSGYHTSGPMDVRSWLDSGFDLNDPVSVGGLDNLVWRAVLSHARGDLGADGANSGLASKMV